MAATPYFLWPAQPSSAAASDPMAVFAFNPAEDSAAMDVAPLHAPELSEGVARPRPRRQASSGSGRQGTGGGTPKKHPQRGLGVAELERLRCGGVDPLQDLNVAAAAAMLEAAANASGAHQGGSVLLHHHHHQDHVPSFDAATGARYYSPLLVQPPPPAPAAPARYVHAMAPEQQYFVDRWGRVGGFVPASGNAGAVGHLQQQLEALAQGPALEQPSSQNTIWRPASSSASCLHVGHRCDLCSKTVRDMTERAPRAPAPAPAAATTTADYSIYDLAAAMAAARKETAGDGYLAREAKKEVREIEFFPASTTANHADVSEFATTSMGRTTPFSNSSSPGGGGYAAPLDLSLRL